MKNNVIVAVLVSLLAGGGLGFFGGMQYQKNQRAAAFGNGNFTGRAGNGQNGSGGRFRNGGGVTGDILSVDKNSITVKLPDGSSKIVLLTNSTNINKATQGSVSDLVAGIRVAAFGTANSDGSITASNVQLNPIMRAQSGTNGASGSAGY